MAETINPPSRVAVIGLGNMGIPMALCLGRAGFDVTAFDVSETARKKFADAGGKVAASGEAAVAKAAAVITLLPDGKIVKAALEPLRGKIERGAVILEMSSSDPIGTQQLGESFIKAGVDFIDAPVSGGVKRAVDGTLSIMAGGDPATIDRVGPVLSAMGRTVFRTGKLGSGHAMKALNNYVSAAGLVAAVEATMIGEKFGLDPQLIADTLNASTGRNNTTEVKLKQFIISRTFGAGFPLKLMAKDVRTADNLAHAMKVASPLADFCADLWDEASRTLDDKADHTAIGMHIEKLKSR